MEWKTKDGRIIDIKDMTDSHLKNTISMLRRNGFITNNDFLDMLGFAFSLNGEMAQDAAESEIANAKISTILEVMETELNKRCLACSISK